jgi:hypothetical protein
MEQKPPQTLRGALGGHWPQVSIRIQLSDLRSTLHAAHIDRACSAHCCALSVQHCFARLPACMGRNTEGNTTAMQLSRYAPGLR